MVAEKQLLETISFQIQRLKPDNIPKPPFNTTPSHTNITPTPTFKSAKAKAKTPTPASALKTKIQGRRPLPVPPTPHPPLANRVSSYSPALVSGVLIDAVKAGMNATEAGGAGGPAGPGAGPGGPGGAGMGKGKRKVVRVRG
jgi:signal recognition particle subunit SRP19